MRWRWRGGCRGWRRGSVFAERYHATLLRSARQVRNALCYVLNNVLHHERGRRRVLGPDPCSSGPWFDGWTLAWRRVAQERGDPGRATNHTSPTATAKSHLLRSLWRRHGLLDPTQRPAGAL